MNDTSTKGRGNKEQYKYQRVSAPYPLRIVPARSTQSVRAPESETATRIAAE